MIGSAYNKAVNMRVNLFACWNREGHQKIYLLVVSLANWGRRNEGAGSVQDSRRARLLIASMLACAVRLVDAQNLSITVSPRLPTTEDMVNITLDFFFASQPPYVKDFGTPTLNENVFTVNVTIYRPAPSDIVLYWTHDDVHTYDLGEMSKGNYEFRVVVTLTHYNEVMQYLAESIRFKVSDRPVEIFDTTGSNGIPDGRVDMWDLANVAIRFGRAPGDALWNLRADVNGDNIINMADSAAVAWHFGERYP